jgi:hypothetical protein
LNDSDRHNAKPGKRSAVKAIIKRQEPVTSAKSVSADQEVSQDAPWDNCAAMFLAAGGVTLERTTGGSPYLLVDIPINCDACIFEEEIEERFISRRESKQLRIYGRGDY